MCGINGLVDLKNQLNEKEIRNIICNFNKSVDHRGPDSDGIYVSKNFGIGHTRLSIIDLSVNGKQPMVCNETDNVISYNGEIYNFIDLKNKYLKDHNFFSGTDTEVLLKLYSKLGIEKTILEINGMYAFSLIDKKKNKLYLSRDKAGEKPLYYYFMDDFILWSSDIRTFKYSPIKNKLKISENSLRNYFDVGYVPSPVSIFENVFKLLPGETLEIDLNNNKKFSFFFEKDNCINEDKLFCPNEFESLLEDAVKIRTISDVPYGVFLSSGIDSSLIASILTKVRNTQINSFSIGLENSSLDESMASKKIAKSLKLNHNELIIKENNIINIIPKVISAYDEPFADSSQIPTYILSQFCKNKITVALSGDGGDEIFGGYNRYIYYQKYKSLFKYLFVINKNNILNNSFCNSIFSLLSNFSRIRESSYKFRSLSNIKNIKDFYIKMITQSNDIDNIYKKNESYQIHYLKGEECKDSLKFMQLKDIKNYLPDDILTKVDRASMAHGLEVRCPFLDKRILEFYKINTKHKISNKNNKIVLKNILSKYLDINLISKKKMGFAVPLHKWLGNELYDYCNDIFNSNILQNDEILNQKSVLSMLQKNRAGNTNYTFLIWSILIYLNWKKSWQQ
jgi:asparagine synthase (glutamine-hydrolysing)